jgi:uncharacterized protein (TIGR00299 family) protein
MIAYLDMPSGISGDMFLGCLVDAGWSLEQLRSTIERLGVPAGSWHVGQERVMRGPLAATLLNVEAAEGDQHRHLHHIAAILDQADLPRSVKSRSLAVFQRLAQAEAAVHGSSIEEVHFHEVGALDAIIDVVGVCAGLEALGIEQLFASSAPLGEGWTKSAHGRIPLPAPATLAILSGAGAPTRPAPGPGELVTPTGAALVAELALFRQPPMRLQRIGMGAGRKDFEWPNVARLWLGQAEPASHTAAQIDAQMDTQIEAMVLLETNIDDMNPELYGGVSRALFAAGARDVWLAPIQMKKERPAVQLSVLAPADHEAALVTTLLAETTTLGVRVQPVTRYAAARTMQQVTTSFGEVQVKVKWIDGKPVGAKPEHEDCVRLAEAQGVPVRVVYEAAAAAAYSTLLAATVPVMHDSSDA